MKKGKVFYISFLLLAVLFVTAYIKMIHMKAAFVSDYVKPNFEIDTLYSAQKDNIPIEHLPFYEKGRYFSFESNEIPMEDNSYCIDFDSVPSKSLRGIPEKYRYFIDHGKVYNKSEHNSFVGNFDVLLIQVEDFQLLNNKIHLNFECSNEDLLCSYIKLVYLSFDNEKIVEYIPLRSVENDVSIVVDRNVRGGILKSIYIFNATEGDSELSYHLKDRYNSMNIKF